MGFYKFFSALMLTILLTASTAHAAGPGFQGECWEKVFHFYGASGKGRASGKSAANAAPIADGDIMAIEAGTIINSVSVIVDTAVTGTTALTIGDDDGAASYCPNASLTLGTPGMYCHNAKVAGAYLRVETAGATDALDVYVVPTAKYYSAAGKEIKLDNTTTNTGGAFRVLVKGCKVGA
jgi:hypothetical protein